MQCKSGLPIATDTPGACMPRMCCTLGHSPYYYYKPTYAVLWFVRRSFKAILLCAGLMVVHPCWVRVGSSSDIVHVINTCQGITAI